MRFAFEDIFDFRQRRFFHFTQTGYNTDCNRFLCNCLVEMSVENVNNPFISAILCTSEECIKGIINRMLQVFNKTIC